MGTDYIPIPVLYSSDGDDGDPSVLPPFMLILCELLLWVPWLCPGLCFAADTQGYNTREVKMMEVNVDPDLCISCGLCVDNCSQVFDWDQNEKAKALVNPVPLETADCCREAIDGCPTQAISGK